MPPPKQSTTLLLLDLDGVLITTPPWKPDTLDADGYSAFNPSCVENLNTLLASASFEIWLTSTRGTRKTLEQFNQIFANRKISTKISHFLPLYPAAKNRREEIELFIAEHDPAHFLILDDDKSLNGLASEQKENLILTDLTTGFNSYKLEEALRRISQQKTD